MGLVLDVSLEPLRIEPERLRFLCHQNEIRQEYLIFVNYFPLKGNSFLVSKIYRKTLGINN